MGGEEPRRCGGTKAPVVNPSPVLARYCPGAAGWGHSRGTEGEVPERFLSLVLLLAAGGERRSQRILCRVRAACPSWHRCRGTCQQVPPWCLCQPVLHFGWGLGGEGQSLPQQANTVVSRHLENRLNSEPRQGAGRAAASEPGRWSETLQWASPLLSWGGPSSCSLE